MSQFTQVPDSRASQRGTTLIETMAMLVVMSLIVAVGAPFMSGYFTTQRIVKSSDVLVGQFDLARQRAITRRCPVEMRLGDPSSGEYTIHEDTNGNGIVDGLEVELGPYALGAGIQFGEVALEGDGLIVFLPSGMLRIGQGGRVGLIDEHDQLREMEIHASGMLTPAS